MKTLITLIASLLLMACTVMNATTDHNGTGPLDSRGRAVGNWNLYSDNNQSIFAKGAYLDGMPHGPWEIWDNLGTKNADLNFEYELEKFWS